MPCFIPWPYRLSLRRRLYGLLKGFGFSDRYLHLRLNLTSISMKALPIEDVKAVLEGAGAVVLNVEQFPDGAIESANYYATKG